MTAVRALDPGEPIIRDADGNLLRQYDDVVLMKALLMTSPGIPTEAPREMPVGTRATAILVVDGAAGLFDLECYYEKGKFAFATGPGSDLRLFRTAEEKLEARVQ